MNQQTMQSACQLHQIAASLHSPVAGKNREL